MALTLPFTNITSHPTKPEIVLSNGTEFLVLNSSTGQILKPYPEGADRKQNYVDLHRRLAFNVEGSLLATSGEDKLLRVYDTSNWALKFTRPVSKRVNALHFNKLGDEIIVADKFGDVYCHPVEEAADDKDSKLAPIVGHVSMVTDMILSSDEKYVITADRDEHIRVSHFPNGYNIQSFCLGHKDVVTCIRLAPWDTTKLISMGGDNTVRVWDFVEGKELHSFDYSEFVKPYLPEATDANSEAAIVTEVEFHVETRSIVLAFAKTAALIILGWDETNNSLAYKEVVMTAHPVLSICFDTTKHLWVTMASSPKDNQRVALYSIEGDKFVCCPCEDERVKQINAADAGLVDQMPDLYTIFGLRKLLDLPEHVTAHGEKRKRRKEA